MAGAAAMVLALPAPAAAATSVATSSAAAAATGPSGIGAAPAGASSGAAASPARSGAPQAARRVCAEPDRPGWARCLAEVAVGTRPNAAAPDGYGPADLRSAYGLPAAGGTGTVAIVDAYGYPSAEADLAAYRAHYGLPACTVESGCLRIVDQRGDSSPLPAGDPDWATETALDLDMASAACPSCRLLLVQGDDASLDSLAAAENTAVELGADVVSNSYGATEFTGMDGYAAAYRHPGVPILASSGDAGFTAASFPAVLSDTISVGGTRLERADNDRGWTEAVWAGAGAGCSAWIAKPAWQHDDHCDMRTVADVSAVADPRTGVAVYDTYQQPGWLVVGGTSAAAPLVAGMIALAGAPDTVTNARLYAQPDAFHDVVGGSTVGYFCDGDYLCNGLPGYDAPSGLGTPRSTAPFQ